jgi:hypothetical protein
LYSVDLAVSVVSFISNTPIKHCKYVANQNLKHFEDVGFRELFVRISEFIFLPNTDRLQQVEDCEIIQCKIFPFLKDIVFLRLAMLFYEAELNYSVIPLFCV